MRNQCLECLSWFQSSIVTNLCEKCGGEKETITPLENEPQETEGELSDEIPN